MMINDSKDGLAYRAQLVDIIERAERLEERARGEWAVLHPDDPLHTSWMRIEQRYATIRGNAQHLLIIHDQRQQRSFQFFRYLNLF